MEDNSKTPSSLNPRLVNPTDGIGGERVGGKTLVEAAK